MSTADLAADMSENFHIDKTPAVPTPRRALFAAPRGGASSSSLSFNSSSPAEPAVRNTAMNSNSPLPHKRELSDSSVSTTSMRPRLSGGWGRSVSDEGHSTTTKLDTLSEMFAMSPAGNSNASATSTTNQLCQDSFETPRPRFARHNKIRRTHSMFQNPAELLTEELNEEKEVVQMSSSPHCGDFSSPMDQSVLSRAGCALKTFRVKDDPFPRICRDTLCEILDGRYSSLYDRCVIIDCRFEYEYLGGHIDGAININSRQSLESELQNGVLGKRSDAETVLLVFHCEYSAHRGPRMAMHLRNCDRQMNMHNYPKLSYPDIVILEGGYNRFFEQYFARCVPQKYVEMKASEHHETCERELGRLRRNNKGRTQSCLSFGAMSSTSTRLIRGGSASSLASTQSPLDNMNSITSTTPTGAGAFAPNFLFPLRERDPNVVGTPTGPPARKLVRIQSEQITQLRFNGL